MEKQSSIEKCFTLLQTLAREKAMGIKELSAATGYPAATVHRMLSTLTRLGYVRQSSGNKDYQLGLNLLKLTSGLMESLDMATVARPVMKKLMESTGETVNLVVFENEEAVYVEQVNSTSSMLRMFTQVGARVPLYCSGVGKAYLAAMADGYVTAYLEKANRVAFTAHTLVTKKEITKELHDIRVLGYAMDMEERELGVACVSAVVSHAGTVQGGISISGPSNRITAKTAPGLGRKVRLAADEISNKLRELGGAMGLG